MSSVRGLSSYCPCGTELQPGVAFCRSCGRRLSEQQTRRALPTWIAAIGGGLATVGLVALYCYYYYLPVADRRAVPSFATSPSPSPNTVSKAENMGREHIVHGASLADPALRMLWNQAYSHAPNLQALQNLSQALTARLDGPGDDESGSYTLAQIDTLRAILDLAPGDSNALFDLANLSFQRHAFQEARGYYERYLKTRPDDLTTQAQYASVLFVTGNEQEALRTLESILERDATHFDAQAYLAVAHAELGNLTAAAQWGEKALPYAPDEERRDRLVRFLEGLSQEEAGSHAVSTAPE